MKLGNLKWKRLELQSEISHVEVGWSGSLIMKTKVFLEKMVKSQELLPTTRKLKINWFML
jgi:hypothetical protein